MRSIGNLRRHLSKECVLAAFLDLLQAPSSRACFLPLFLALFDLVCVIEDVISAPILRCPPVRRVTATKDEEDNALEYGLSSSHTLNIVCLSGYLFFYLLSYNQNGNSLVEIDGLAVVCLFIGFIALGIMCLGMHSLIDILGGLLAGLIILAFWLLLTTLLSLGKMVLIYMFTSSEDYGPYSMRNCYCINKCRITTLSSTLLSYIYSVCTKTSR